MTELNILSCNINGLNGPHKRTGFLELLRQRKVDIALIQESHLRKNDVHRCNNKFYEVVSFAATDNKTKGVLIIVKRKLNISILDKKGDDDGRITCIKTLIDNRKVAFLSVYAPCSPDPAFFSELSTYLTDLTDFEIVMGTDMNAVMSHDLDRSGGKFSYSQTVSTDQPKECIISFSLVDTWRLFNPSQKLYTFFSARHKSYSRLHFCLLYIDLIDT